MTEAPAEFAESLSTTISPFDAEVLSKLSAVLATDTTNLNNENIDVITDDQGIRHELIASSSSTISRRIRRDTGDNSEDARPQIATLPIVYAKTAEISVGIPEKFVTSANDAMTDSNSSAVTLETSISAKSDDRRRSVSHKRNSSHSSASKKNKSSHRRKTSTKRQPLTKQTSSGQKKSRARGTLYGLSTLRRQGNVRVNVMGDYTTVKSNFVLGPLVLKVEKAFGRGSKRELKSATATTTQMIGRISLRIINGAATLHSIKVQQPKQVPSNNLDIFTFSIIDFFFVGSSR